MQRIPNARTIIVRPNEAACCQGALKSIYSFKERQPNDALTGNGKVNKNTKKVNDTEW